MKTSWPMDLGAYYVLWTVDGKSFGKHTSRVTRRTVGKEVAQAQVFARQLLGKLC